MLATGLLACSGNDEPPAAPVDHDVAGVIVVLGSSTAVGTGATQAENAWVERYRAHLADEFPNFQLFNLAASGFTTYQIQPSDFTPPSTRPVPNTTHNITFALTFEPDAIIINMPSNDQRGNIPLSEQLDNYARVTELAAEHGALSWVTTTQPRNFELDARRDELMAARDAIQETYGDRSIDFWTPLAEADGRIQPAYDSGDGTHVNDAAHGLLVAQVIAAAIPETLSRAAD